MPVGLVVVADQAFVQDVLTAVANCKLRFQTVQTTLTRFRGSLSYVPQTPGGFGPGSPPMTGEGPSAPPAASGPPRPVTPGTGSGPPAGPPRPMAPGSGFGPPPGVLPGVPPGFGGMPGFFGGGAPMSSSDDQTAGNLIEVGVYGIASLYEKFDPNQPKTDAAGAGPAPAPAPAGPAAPVPPAAGAAAGTTTTTKEPMTPPVAPPTTPAPMTPAPAAPTPGTPPKM